MPAPLPDPAPSAEAPAPGAFPTGDPLTLTYWRAVAGWYAKAADFWKADAIKARAAHNEAVINAGACAEGLAPQLPVQPTQ